MMSIAFKEGLKIPPQAMEQIIIGANQDVRQVGQWLTKAHVEKLKFYQLLRRTRGLRGLPYWSRFKCTTGLPPAVCRYQLPVEECQASNVRNSMHTDFLERRSSSPFFKVPFDINTTPLPKLNTKIKVMSNKKKVELFVLIFQVLHNMSMWTAKEKSLSYDQAKADAANAQKDIKIVRRALRDCL